MSTLPLPIIGDSVTGETIDSGDAGPILAESFNAFGNLAAGGPGRKILLLEMNDTGDYRSVAGPLRHRYASHHFCARPDDPAWTGTHANQYFEPRMKPGFSINRSIVNGSLLRGKSVPDKCTATLINLDGRASAPPSGQDMSVRILSDGWYYNDAKVIFQGLVDQVTPATNGKTVTITSQDPSLALQKPLQSNLYRGFGPALQLTGVSGSRIRFPYNAGFAATTSLCAEVYLRLTNQAHSATVGYGIVGRGLSGNAWGFQVNNDWTLSFYLKDAGGSYHTASTPGVALAANTDYHLAARWDGALLQIFVNGLPTGSAVAFAGIPWADTSDLYFGTTTGTDAIEGWFAEGRAWVDTPRTDAQIFANAFQPLASDDTLGLALYAMFEEGSGTDTYDNIHFYDGKIEGTGTSWTTSFTGTPDLLGKPIPTSWGTVWHRDAVLVDPNGRLYQAHHRGILQFDGVFAGGRKLAPLYSFTANDVRYDATRKRIYLGAGSAADIAVRSFRDLRCFAVGQTITLGGASTQPGDYTVVDVDEETGLWVQVSQTLTTASNATLAVTIGTKTGTHEYVPDSGRGVFVLVATANLIVTCRLRGDAPTGPSSWVSTAADIIKRMATDMMGVDPATISTSFADVAASNPAAAQYATTTAVENADVIFSKLAITNGATWGYTVDTNQLDLDVFTAPPGSPDTTTNYLALTRAEILSIEQVMTVQPVVRSVAQYRHNFAKLQWNQLSGSLQADTSASGVLWKQFLVRDFLEAPFGSAVVSTIAQAEDRFDCYLVNRPDALAMAVSQYALYGGFVNREVYKVTLKLQPYQFDHRRLVWNLTHHLYPTLVSGKNFKTVSFDGSRTGVVAEVWG